MKVALVYSLKCSGNLPPGGFDIDGLYENHGLTGSESGFFNAAWGLAERLHHVDAYCLTPKAMPNIAKLGGVNVFPMVGSAQMPEDYDAIIAWNDPSHLPPTRKNALRVCSQQINDFSISTPDYDRRTDLYAFPSASHRDYMIEACKLNPAKCAVVPNSTNVEFFPKDLERKPYSMLYCSSPDRGLHRLLDIFPLVRKQQPEANLKIFYRFWPWYDHVKQVQDLVGARARYIGRKLKELGEDGENGIYLIGPVPNKTLAMHLATTKLMVYPCTTVRYTEGFSISTLDACASGCLPLISDTDALGSIYEGNAEVIKGEPRLKTHEWVETICRLFENENERSAKAQRARKFAQMFSREAIALEWEGLLEDTIKHGVS